jgi:fibronectin type III domain protein
MIFGYRFVCSLAFGFYLISLAGCGEGGEGGSGGAMAAVAWDPVNDPTVTSYTVHYGKQPSGSLGSCNYENSVDVAEPSVSIGGLEFNAQYYFAVSAFNGANGACSNEISEKTPAEPSNATPM